MGRKKEGVLGQRLPLDNDEEEGGFLKTRHLRGAWGVFLWYHLGTIPVPCPHHAPTTLIPCQFGVSKTLESRWKLRGFGDRPGFSGQGTS